MQVSAFVCRIQQVTQDTTGHPARRVTVADAGSRVWSPRTINTIQSTRFSAADWTFTIESGRCRRSLFYAHFMLFHLTLLKSQLIKCPEIDSAYLSFL